MSAGFDYDLFVIGAGSGGVRAARIAALHGAKVAIAEEYRIGGTCVIRGCVPKKLFYYASQFAEEFADAAGYGWTIIPPTFSWPALVAAKDKEITRLQGFYVRNLEKAGVRIYETRAVLEDAHTVRLGSGEKQSAKTILVATGARSVRPAIPGIEHAITSNEAFHLKSLPKRILIVGGGYIAAEFAGIFAGLGVKVRLSYRGEKILRGFDTDLRSAVQEAMRTRGIEIALGENLTAIETAPRGLIAQFASGAPVETDCVMFAVGRVPNTDGLGLDAAGVERDSIGAVVVDEYSKSNVDNIYAIGDVTNRLALTPVAIREGHAFADTVFGGRKVAVDHTNAPTAVFSQPPIGTVGYTEDAARAKFGDIDIYRSSFRPLKATLSGRQEKIVMKLVVEAKTGRVLGCHIVGQDGPEIIQAVAIAVKLGATKAQFDATLALHPTAAEELVLLREKSH